MNFGALPSSTSPDAIIATTLDGDVRFWSSGATAMFGYATDEVLGRPVSNIIVAQDRYAGKAGFGPGLPNSGSVTYESGGRCKDGSLLRVDVSCNAVRDDGGDETLLLLSLKNVTHSKELRDSTLLEARFRDLLESMPDGIVMVNASGRIVLASTQAEALFGYERGALRGEPIEKLLPSRFHAAHVHHRSTFMSQSRVRSMGAGLELFGLRRDNTEFPVEIRLSPLETDEGTVVLSAIRDITERKRVEHALQEKNIELVNANLAKDQFLANMSHELRTPLNAIIGFTGTMLMKLPGPLNAEQEKQLRTVQTSARHLLQLINDVLDLSKVEVGKMEFFPELFTLAKVVDEVCAVIAPLAHAKDILVRKSIAAEVETVTLDQQKFRQVLFNLLTNAVKFTDAGGQVTITGELQESDWLRLQVRDTGIGIRSQDMHKLFVEFQQLDSSSARGNEGTGLGLALTRKLVELQGGSIRVESRRGEGEHVHGHPSAASRIGRLMNRRIGGGYRALALLPPLATFAVQWMLWPHIKPYAWVLFYPAVFFSSWLGGVAGGLMATALSVVLVWYFFIPPEMSFALESRWTLISVAIFAGMGVALSLLHERLRVAIRHATEANDELRRAYGQLEVRVIERATELARTNESLLLSEARQQAIVENLAEGVGVADLQGNVVQLNRAAIEMHGFSNMEEWQRNLNRFPELFEITTLDGTPCNVDEWPLGRILRGERLRNLEVRIRRVDSDWIRVFSYGGSIVPNASGQPIMAVFTVSDITERKQVEVQLGKFASLAQNSLEFIGMSDLAGVPFFVNSAALRLVGLDSLEQARATQVSEFFFPEDRSFITDEFLPKVQRDGHAEVEIRFRHFRTAEPIWMIYNVFTLRDDTGNPVAFATVSRDISARKRAEQALLDANEALERNVAERTAELRIAKDRAEATDQLKTEFLAHMSHELRTPLNAIIGFTGTLLLKLPGPLNTDQVRQLATVQGSAEHLLSLINDLLDVSKIEAGKTEAYLESIECRHVIEDVAKTLAEVAKRKGLELGVTMPEEALLLRTDRRMLRQIVLNLVSNAIKFTDRGHVRVSASNHDAGLRHGIRIRVEDTGVGIRAGDQGRIFERFTQIRSSRETNTEGTGLGLHLSQRLAGLLGGNIAFESEFGTGSTFTLTLEEA